MTRCFLCWTPLNQANPSLGTVEWRSYRPSAAYYPESFLNSRDDTPDLYTESKLRKIRLRTHLKNYFGINDTNLRKLSGPIRLNDDVPANCLHYVSVIDLVPAQPKAGFVTKTTGRLSLDNSIPVPTAEDHPPTLVHALRTGLSLQSTEGSPQHYSRTPEETAVSIFAAFLEGRFIETGGGVKILTADQKQDLKELRQWKEELERPCGVLSQDVVDSRTRLHTNLVKALDDMRKQDEVKKAQDQLHHNLMKVLHDSVCHLHTSDETRH